MYSGTELFEKIRNLSEKKEQALSCIQRHIYEGIDKWLRRWAPVLKVHGSNPAMTWLKIPTLLSFLYRH